MAPSRQREPPAKNMPHVGRGSISDEHATRLEPPWQLHGKIMPYATEQHEDVFMHRVLHVNFVFGDIQ
jgi:hypothetical protein